LAFPWMRDGWKTVKPFIKRANVPYPITLGNDATAKKYGIETCRTPFVIDHRDRIGANHVGLVDKDAMFCGAGSNSRVMYSDGRNGVGR
jgi:hypothetical protein